ncbi:sensor histidine kinase [Chondrinema litorale]|uniref:sensor histidine kinase n=1 Tax=Chondrinema litorale TaxID=2994555 RepID=UPI0025434EAB|nr:HAMP domain-containing sensor histidine kinase [Chondrinema litorale]UZR97250.1 HAMP domain-containing sensor histidine kinase [Chondrinema litorale]
MKSKIAHSLFWRIAATLLLLLSFLGVSYVLITAYMARQYYQETTQRLNADVAQHLIEEVQPFVDGKVNKEALGLIMHSMMAVNPSIEVYLLDKKGEILSYVVMAKDVKLKNIDLEPVNQFIDADTKKLVMGQNPRKPDQNTIFSAARVEENGALQGYVYIILMSGEYEHVSGALWNSYLMRTSTSAFLITLVATLLIGLFIIWLLTRNLRKIVNVVSRFEQGDLHARIDENFKGEMALLSNTFNSMANTILQNIEDLKQVDVLRKELIANVSHDLRTPISVISGYIETLNMKQGNLSAEEQRKYMDTIMKSIEKLKRLVNDLFELSKLEARQVNPKKECFALEEVLSETYQKYQVLAVKKNIQLEIDYQSAPTVYADLSMIERVLQNLMDNAIKYTPEHGKVELKLRENSTEDIEIQIRNTGAGIPESELPNIFDRYYKGAHHSGSTGLGLAIVKNILDIHEAPIKVSSMINQYTDFSFSLPRYVYKS